MRQITLTMDDENLEKIDAYRKSVGISRSAIMQIATLEWIAQRTMMSEATKSVAEMKEMFEEMKRMSEKSSTT